MNSAEQVIDLIQLGEGLTLENNETEITVMLLCYLFYLLFVSFDFMHNLLILVCICFFQLIDILVRLT